MVEILKPDLDRRGKKGGQCKLCVEDQLLLVLEYWREYRTQFHIGTSWDLSVAVQPQRSESAVCRLILKVETLLGEGLPQLLMTSGKFRLPGKKQIYQQADSWQVIVVDVTESPIERPRKSGCNRAEVSSACVAPSNNEITTVTRKSTIR